MKRILTFLLMAITVQLSAQNYLITGISINLPANPDANTANWGSGASILTISATTKPDPRGIISDMVKVSKILVTIKKGGTKVCGSYTNSTAPASNFTTATKVWNGRNAVSLVGQDCILKPGEYELCVQFFGPKNDPISDEKCKPFSIRAEELQSYQPPQAISPADGSVIKEADVKKPVTFRWTPVTPKPKDAVTYKLVVFEIRQGQTASSAVKSASPLLEKEVNNLTQFVLPSLNQLTIAKGSSYGWYVQAVGPKGNPIGGNNGMSGLMVFSVKSADIMITDFKVICGSGIGNYNFSLTTSNAGNNAFNAMSISIYPAATLSGPIIPSLPSVVNANGGTKTFTGSFSYSGSLPNFVYAKIEGHQVGNTNLISQDTEVDTITACICTFCDSVTINIPAQGTISMDSTLWLQTPVVTVTPGGVKSIKTQLLYFEYKPETDGCVPCNRDSLDWGNFIGGTFSDNEFPMNGLLTHGHELQWITGNTNGALVNGQFNFNISLPPLVKCCKLEVKFCIRYIFEYIDCSVCDKVVCYSYSKTN